MRTIDDMVRMEVYYCVSSLVSTLANGYQHVDSQGRDAKPLRDVCEQAADLCSPIDDWEEAAISESWTGPHKDEFGATYFQCGADATTWAAADWESLCRDHDIEPYQWEVFEHWIVSDWLASRLREHGEKVDDDFAGLTVWARTTTGQGIASDGVIQSIYAAAHKGDWS